MSKSKLDCPHHENSKDLTAVKKSYVQKMDDHLEKIAKESIIDGEPFLMLHGTKRK